MKKLIALILLAALAAISLTPAMAVVEASEEFYVADYAGVLKQDTKNNIIDSNSHETNGLEALCNGAQIVVVTVEYLDGMYSDEYAMTLFNNWGVGSAEYNNGMLLLLATKEDKAWLTVGSGITGVFTESMVNSYFDRYFWEDYEAGDFDGAVNKMLEPLFTWYADYYSVNNAPPPVENPAPEPSYRPNSRPEPGYNTVPGDDRSSGGGFFTVVFGALAGFLRLALIIAVIVVVIIISSATSDRRRYHSYYTHMGTPPPPYHFWYMWGGHRPHRVWYHDHHRHGPRGPGPRGPGPRGPGPRGPGPRGPGPRGPGPGPRPPRGPGGGSGFGGFGGGGRSSGSGGGRSSGGGFGGFGSGGGRSSGGGFGGFGGGGGGGHSGGGGGHGGGGHGGGGGGRR